METITNPYLLGAFAPVQTEHTAHDLPVTGTIPAELDGRYLRNGPNPLEVPDPAKYHWFTGAGMVHGIRLRDGRAEWYRNRWVRSTAISEALGEQSVPGVRHADMEAANTNVIGHAGKTFAIVEAGGSPVELTEELDNVCFSNLDGTLPHGYTAHPKRHPDTGELHAISYYWGRPNVAEYSVIGVDGRVRHLTDVALPGNPMIHDCSITERFIAVYDQPVTFNLDAVLAGESFPYLWDPGYGNRIGLLPLGADGAEVRWFEVGLGYVFHPMNAFDDGDAVVIDVVRHPRMFDRNRLGPDEGTPTLWRWRLDLRTGTVQETQIDDRPVEFPRVDERLVGKAHRYGWCTRLGDEALVGSDTGSTLVHYDRQTGAVTDVPFGAGRSAGEAVFVPRSDDAAEDDGWFLVLVYDAATDRSELQILPAQDPASGPVATVHLPDRVPAGFHGNWVPTAR